MDIPVVYEDESIIVIDKPRGIVSNRAATVRGMTLQDWMEERFKFADHISPDPQTEDEKYFVERCGLVHRLDKETSGVMVLAKTTEAFIELLRQFREREVQKTYLALTHGIWQTKTGVINLAVGRRRDNRQRMGIREDGRESVTEYQIIAEYNHPQFPSEKRINERGYSGFALVEFKPRTGRMHQIRVHARSMGHPVVGDALYGGRKRSREDLKWAPGLMLLAKELQLTHPTTKLRMKFVSKLDLLAMLGWMDEQKVEVRTPE